MAFTLKDFENLDSRLNQITSQKVEEFEVSSDTPPTLDDLPDSNKAYALYAAILFIDIRKSTELTEKSHAKSMVKIYRAFMRLAVSCVRANGGVTRQFLGDRIMGVFLSTLDENGNVSESAVDKAVKAAQAMQTCIDYSLNKHLQQHVGGKTISCGIGIDYGKVLLTKVGMYGVEKDDSKENETDCVWVGNCTNKASKYSDLSSGGEIFISNKVFNKLSSCLKSEGTWTSTAKQKGNMLFKGYTSQNYYLDFAYDLDKPAISELGISEETFNLASTIQQIDSSWQGIAKKEGELKSLEQKLNMQKAENHVQANENKKAELKLKLDRNHLLSSQRDFYNMLCEYLKQSHCDWEYISSMGYEFWSKLIDEVFSFGKLTGKSDDDIISQNDCYLIGIYDYYKEYAKAYNAMIVMANRNHHWVSIKRNTLLWAKEQSIVWKLRSEIEKSLNNSSIKCNHENYQKALDEIKKIVGY